MDSAPTFRTLLLFIILSVIGYALLPLLPLQYLPENKSSTIRVSYSWPDATPVLLEQKATAPMEAAFGLVEGVKRVKSSSGFGAGSIRLELDEAADVDFVKYQISNRLRQLHEKLPYGLAYPKVEIVRAGNNENEQPLLIWSLSGGYSPYELQGFAADLIIPQLALEPGVGRVEIAGGNGQELQIILDSELLDRLKIEKSTIRAAITDLLTEVTLGTVDYNPYVIKLVLVNHLGDGRDSLLQILRELPLIKRGGRIIKLGEIAELNIKEQKPTGYYRVNGESGIRLLLFKSTGANSIIVSDRMKRRLSDVANNLPENLKISLDHDEAQYLREELQKVKQRTLWSLGILLLFVLIAYQNFRQLVALSLALIVTMGLAFIGYYLLDVQLHLYAIAGITVSFGIIIDNAIVVIHHLRNRKQHAVLPALMASTFTTLAALVVLWRLPEEWQMNLLAFGQVLFVNLVASLAVAWWLMPALLSRLGLLQMKQKNSQGGRMFKMAGRYILAKYRSVLHFLVHNRKLFIAMYVLLFGLPVFMLPNQVEGWAWYNKTFGNDWYMDNVRPVVDKALGGTLRLFSWYVWEGSTWRQPEATQLFVEGKMPQGATVEQLNEVFKYMEAYIGNYQEGIQRYVTKIDGSDFGQIVITFDNDAEVGLPYILKNKLIAFSLNFGGVKWNIYGVGRGFSNENNNSAPVYQVKMSGYNRNQLQTYAARLSEKLALHPRVKDIVPDANLNWWEKDRYVFNLHLDQETAAYLGIGSDDLLQLMDKYNRAEAIDFYLPGGVPVRLVNDEATWKDAWTLMNRPEFIDSVRLFMPDIGTIEKTPAPLAIHKENQQYIQVLKFTYTGSYRFGIRFLKEKLEELGKEMLPGYSTEIMERSWKKEGNQYMEMLLLVVVLIFFICAITFESLLQPFVVILSIPMSFVGIFLTFYWFDFPLDQGGYTSFLMVSGLAVNGLILVLNEFNAIRKEGNFPDELGAFVAAIQGKFLPIFLSVISTVLGLVPFTIHGEGEVFWFSLAVGTMGGLLFSLLVILFMMPVFLCRKTSSHGVS